MRFRCRIRRAIDMDGYVCHLSYGEIYSTVHVMRDENLKLKLRDGRLSLRRVIIDAYHAIKDEPK